MEQPERQQTPLDHETELGRASRCGKILLPLNKNNKFDSNTNILIAFPISRQIKT